MNALVLSLLSSILVVEYLVRERGLLHPYVVLLPELLSAIAMALVLIRMMAGARIRLDWRYTLFLCALAITMIFGFVTQEVPSGAIVAGIRAHLKFIPFFLLPVVYKFTPAQLKTQFVFLLVLFIAQGPLSLYQRFIEYADMMQTGDPVRGTATTSSALSILMMCGIAAIVAMFLRKQLRFKYAIFLMALLFFPTTLNETKATLLLLPLAIVVPLYFMPRGSRALRRAVPIFAVGAVALVAFIAVYDYFIQYATTGQPIGQFVGEASFSRYLYSGAAEEGEANYIGRFDSVQFAMDHITKDPLKLAFGYGAGNVSLSFLPQFNGAYAAYYDRYGVGMTQVTTFLWEIGVVGLLTYLMLYAFVLHDARMLSRLDGEAGLLGQIWATVAVIMVFGLIYKSVFSMTEIGYLFWFYTGVVAARAVEHRVSLRATARRNRPRLQQGGRPSDARYGGLAEAKP